MGRAGTDRPPRRTRRFDAAAPRRPTAPPGSLCSDADATAADLAFPLLDAAWQHVGFPELADRTRLFDMRSANLEWRQDDRHGWHLYQSGEAYEVSPVQAASNRVEYGNFPFGEWRDAFAAATQRYRALRQPDWLTCHDGRAGDIARNLADGMQFQSAPILADALEEAGCEQISALNALRSGIPAQVGWVLEWLLDAPLGSLLRRYFGRTPAPTVLAHFDIRIPEPLERTRGGLPTLGDAFAEELDHLLSQAKLGQARCHTMPENLFGEDQVCVVKVSHSGSLDDVRKVLRGLLSRHALPPESRVEICNSDRQSLPIAWLADRHT